MKGYDIVKNKKKILIGVSSILVLIVGIFIYLYVSKDNEKEIYIPKKEEVKTQISGFNGISMMYETGPGTGEYSESKSSLWPEDGYIFNDTLSGCENGGELSWDEEKKAVILNSLGSDACYVYFDAYIIPVINSVSTSNITNDSITLTVNATNGNNPITTYYYSSNNGTNYVESTNNTYTFNNLEMGTEYNFSVYVKDSLGYESEVYTLSETTDDTPPTLADTCRETGSNTLACHVATQYTIDGENGLYYHDEDLANGAGDNSYRYAGANPNNYVCFGSTASTCPSDNLYRIIGVFGNEVKLIKWDYANSNLLGTSGAYSSSTYSASSYENYDGAHSTVDRYYWTSSSNSSNVWSESALNTTNLNGTYLNGLGSTWSNKIANHSWKVGGGSSSYLYSGTPRTAYNYEVGSNSSSTTYNAKIGLMYVSDYGYAASNNYWTTTMSNYDDAISSNWMYMGMREWTISRYSDLSDRAFFVSSTGTVNGNGVLYNYFAVRPSFYLTSSTTYAGGTGEASSPIRVN